MTAISFFLLIVSSHDNCLFRALFALLALKKDDSRDAGSGNTAQSVHPGTVRAGLGQLKVRGVDHCEGKDGVIVDHLHRITVDSSGSGQKCLVADGTVLIGLLGGNHNLDIFIRDRI